MKTLHVRILCWLARLNVHQFDPSLHAPGQKMPATPYTIAYLYDYMGELTQLTYPSGRKVSYAYSSSAELNKVTDVTSTNFDYVSGASYSPLGTLQQLNLANQVATTLGWNNLARLTSILTQKSGSAALLNLGYSYYANDQIQQITNNLDSLKTEKYTYDELRRLLTAQRGPDTNIQRKYSYDYDRFGNRWAQTLVAGSGFGGTNSFDYAGNRVTTTNFTYDNSGNITANGPGTSFTFNAENFMTAAGASASYSVDTRGRRTKKTVSGTTTNYFYSGSVVISEQQGSTWTDYIFFGNQRIAQQTGSTLTVARFLHQDHLGSTRVCSDGSGNSAGTCDYEPFGEFQPGSACSSLPTNYRFAGMYYDSESGLYYTWFRQYDANQGRWMGVDPVAGSASDPQSLDRYAYVAGDPPNLIDPVGLSATCRPPCVVDSERDKCVCPDPPDPPGMHFVDIPGACLVIYKNGIQTFNSCSGGTEPIPRPDRDDRPDGQPKPPAPQPPTGLQSRRLPDESFADCFNRLQRKALGETGQSILHAVSGVSLLTAISTVSIGTRLASAGALEGTNIIQTTIAPGPSLLEQAISKGVAQGDIAFKGATAAARGIAGVVSKVSIGLFVGAAAIEGAFAFLCR